MKVQVRVNERGALRNGRFAFTNKLTLVSELLQNARRAGAWPRGRRTSISGAKRRRPRRSPSSPGCSATTSCRSNAGCASRTAVMREVCGRKYAGCEVVLEA